MSLYFFHVADGRDYPDLRGSDLVNLDAARAEALRYTSQLLSNAVNQFWDGAEWTMTVTDAAGMIFFTLNFFAVNAPVSGPTSQPTSD
jgi:hypothetical protein